jgi:glycosyltransferase involved in cell wall biosynthesis
MNVIVVMPAYNAAQHIAATLERIRALPQSSDFELTRIIVVDDGSQDETRAIVSRQLAGKSAIALLACDENRGYGAAMKLGLRAAYSHRPEVVATVHADGQYSPEVLPALVRALQVRQLDVLQGSRIAGGGALTGGMPLYKYAANACLNKLENAVLQLSLSDYHSGYMLYSPRALEHIAFDKLSDSFDFDLEMIASACARKLRVAEAPIPTHYGDEISHLQPVAYGLRVLRVLWKYSRGHYA